MYLAEDLRDGLRVGGLTLPDVAEHPAADERDPSMSEFVEVRDREPNPKVVIDLHARDEIESRPLPHRNDGHMRAPKIFQQARLIAHVAQEDDPVALPRF
jgi:hypothetical protein